MSAGLTAAVVLYAAALALLCLVAATRGRPRGQLVLPALVVVELGLLAQALLDAQRVAHGPRPAELATHLGYLVTSVVVLPVALTSVRLEDGRWGSVAVAVGCLLAAVVSIRLQQTLAAPRRA